MTVRCKQYQHLATLSDISLASSTAGTLCVSGAKRTPLHFRTKVVPLNDEELFSVSSFSFFFVLKSQGRLLSSTSTLNYESFVSVRMCSLLTDVGHRKAVVRFTF